MLHGLDNLCNEKEDPGIGSFYTEKMVLVSAHWVSVILNRIWYVFMH